MDEWMKWNEKGKRRKEPNKETKNKKAKNIHLIEWPEWFKN